MQKSATSHLSPKNLLSSNEWYSPTCTQRYKFTIHVLLGIQSRYKSLVEGEVSHIQSRYKSSDARGERDYKAFEGCIKNKVDLYNEAIDSEVQHK